MMMAGRSWSELLPEILTQIAEQLPFYEDLIPFRGVCRSWESASAAVDTTTVAWLPSRLPYLLLAEREDEDEDDVRDLFFLSYYKEEEEDNHNNKKIINKVMLPEARKKRCLSSHGWLLTIETPDGSPHLLHPYSRRQFVLPNIDTFPEFHPIKNDHLHYISKFLLSSSDPSSPDFLVIVIWGGKGKVGFCRLGDASWTVFDEWRATIDDITYYDGLVYATDSTSCILVCDVHGKGPLRVQLIAEVPVELQVFGDINYILRSSNAKDRKLLIVNKHWRYLNHDIEPEYSSDENEREYFRVDNDERFAYKSMRFQVLEFTFNNNRGGQWRKLDDLGGNRALFLGYNSTFMLEIEAGEQGYIKPDCIYYTDDNMEKYLNTSKGGGSDMGIYHMRDGSFETLFDLWESRSLLTPPTWVFDESCF